MTGRPFFYEASEPLFSCVCALEPARTSRIAGELMPVCSRCAGVLFGIGLGLLVIYVGRRPLGEAPPSFRAASVAAVLLTIASGLAPPSLDLPRPGRFALAALAGLGATLIVAPTFTRRVLDVASREWRGSERLVAVSTALFLSVALPLAQRLGLDFISPVALVALPAFGLVASAIVLRVLVVPQIGRGRLFALAAITTAGALALGRALRVAMG